MTPEEEEQVRRALAAAPPVPPLPAEVAARLDATLAGLVADRSASSPDPAAEPARESVGDEVAARRRRRWPKLLVAAAAVCIVGYGAGAVVTDGMSGSGDASSAGGAAAPEAADKYAAGGDSATASEGEVLAMRPARLSSATLAADLQRLVDDSPALQHPARSDGAGIQADRGTPSTAIAACTVPASRPGDTLTAVRLDGRAATLVLRAEKGGVRVAQIHSCGDPVRVLASSRVRVP